MIVLMRVDGEDEEVLNECISQRHVWKQKERALEQEVKDREQKEHALEQRVNNLEGELARSNGNASRLSTRLRRMRFWHEKIVADLNWKAVCYHTMRGWYRSTLSGFRKWQGEVLQVKYVRENIEEFHEGFSPIDIGTLPKRPNRDWGRNVDHFGAHTRGIDELLALDA